MAIFVPRFLRQLRDVLISSPADGEVVTYDIADGKWKNAAGGGGGLTFAQILAALDAIGVTIDPLTGAVTISPSEFDAKGLSIALPAGAAANFTSFIEFRTNEIGDEDKLVGDIDATGYMRLTNWVGDSGFDFSTNQVAFPENAFRVIGPFNITGTEIDSSALSLAYLGLWFDPTNGAPRFMLKGKTLDGTVVTWEIPDGVYSPGGGAPTTATYITQTADGGLSAEQALSALATGLMKNTTGTGVLSIGAQGTDYWAPGGTDVAVADGGTGASTAAGARTNLDVPSNAEAVLDSLFDADTVLAADSDNTPAAVTMAASTILARLAAGNIKAATPAEIATLLQAYTVGGTDVAVADGGTGASTAATGLANLGGLPQSAVPIQFKTGRYYQQVGGSIGSGVVVALNDLQLTPFWVPKTTTFDRIGVDCTSAVATSVTRLGIYNQTDGYPTTVVLDAGTVATSSGTGLKEITISQQLTPGLYFLAVVGQTAAPSLRTANVPYWNLGSDGVYSTSLMAYLEAGISGALGTFTSSITKRLSNAHIVYLRALSSP